MSNSNCLEGVKCPVCGNEAAFRVVATASFLLTDDGTDFGEQVEYDANSPVSCVECSWSGVWSEASEGDPKPVDRESAIKDVLRWFDDLSDIVENNPADIEDWVVNGADHFDALRTAR